MPEDLNEDSSVFEKCDAVLYRYHAIRLKSTFIKDLSRLGRPIESVVIVDYR